ncbi:MAG: YciI family protein [Chloroflexota bacterium]
MPSTPQFLYRIQPTRATMLTEGATPEEGELVSQHFNRLKKLMEAGVVILARRTLNTDSSTFGIVIFNADSEEAARALMNDDPAVKGGVFSAELFPYRVALITEGNAN